MISKEVIVRANAAQLAVDVGCLHLKLCEGRGGCRIFAVQSSPDRVSNLTSPLSILAAIRSRRI